MATEKKMERKFSGWGRKCTFTWNDGKVEEMSLDTAEILEHKGKGKMPDAAELEKIIKSVTK